MNDEENYAAVEEVESSEIPPGWKEPEKPSDDINSSATGTVTVLIVFFALLAMILVSNKGNNLQSIYSNMTIIEAKTKKIKDLYDSGYAAKKEHLLVEQKGDAAMRFGQIELDEAMSDTSASLSYAHVTSDQMEMMDPLSTYSMIVLSGFRINHLEVPLYDFELKEYFDEGRRYVSFESKFSEFNIQYPETGFKADYFFMGNEL